MTQDNNSKKPKVFKLTRTRIILLWALIITLPAYLVANLVVKQILEPDIAITQGNNRVIRNKSNTPPRGTIYDRFGKILALSIPQKKVYANPSLMHSEHVYDNQEKMQKIADILNLDIKYLYERTKDPAKKQVNLNTTVDLPTAKKLLKIVPKGLDLIHSYRRYYPTGEANANIIGILNSEDVGVYGVEQSFNSYLTPAKSTIKINKDRLGNTIEILGKTEGNNGRPLYLSIDNRLQTFTYSSLKACVEENNAEAGTAVLLDVKTGEILAMASAPSFDPNDRSTFNPANAKNRTITDIIEPGSTLKPYVSLAALEAKATNWSEVFDTRSFVVDGKLVTDSHKMNTGTLSDIIKYSSNTGMARIAMRLGPSKIMNLLMRFGFGRQTESGLTGESPGKLNANRPFWANIDKATLGFGYGVNVTTLQLASAYATLANGGLRHDVSILKLAKVKSPTATIESRLALEMQKALETVVDGGTGGKAAINRYRVAGKTGTAKIAIKGGYGKDYVATFAGFAPISNPRFAMVVVITAPRGGKFYGGAVSGPVFQDVMSRALQLYNVKPDREFVKKK